MALVGDYIEIKQIESKVNFKTVEVTYPQDFLDETKAGKTETITVPEIEEEKTAYENCYCIVRAASTHQMVGNDGIKTNFVSCVIHIYANKEKKKETFTDPIWHEVFDFQIADLSELNDYTDPMHFAYSKLSEMDAFSNMVKD